MIGTFIAASLKALVLLLLAAAIAAIAGRGRPRLRAVVWSSAMLGLLCLPLLDLTVPKLRIDTPAWFAELNLPQRQTTVEVSRSAATPTQATTRPRLGAAPTPAEHPPPIDAATALGALWALGLGLLLVRQAVGWVVIRRTLRAATPAPDDWDRSLSRCMRLANCRRRPLVVVSRSMSTPATSFFIRPVILLPARCHQWLLERREIVLQHELVHVARGDWLVRECARLACAVHWFNPLAWWGLRRLVDEQERACDAAVVAAGTRPSSYAATLLELARSTTGPAPVPVLEMAHRHQLEGRIMRILNSITSTPSRSLLCTVAILFAALVPTIAAVQIGAAEPRQASPQLQQAITNLDEVEQRLQPHLDRIADVEIDAHISEQVEEALEAAGIDEIVDMVEPITGHIDDLDLAPMLERVAELTAGISEIDIWIGESPDLAEIEAMVDSQTAGIEAMVADLEPIIEQIRIDELDLAPMLEQLESLERSLEPRMQELEQRMEEQLAPLQADLERFEKEFEPLEREIEQWARVVETEVAAEVASVIAEHLGPVTTAGADFSEAAHKIVDGASIHLDGGSMTVRSSAGETREILRDLFAGRHIGAQANFDAAVDAAAEELRRLEILVSGN